MSSVVSPTIYPTSTITVITEHHAYSQIVGKTCFPISVCIVTHSLYICLSYVCMYNCIIVYSLFESIHNSFVQLIAWQTFRMWICGTKLGLRGYTLYNIHICMCVWYKFTLSHISMPHMGWCCTVSYLSRTIERTKI